MKPQFNFWKLSNELEELANKIDNTRSALDVIAQNIMNDPESGAIWMVVDVLQTHVDTLEQFSAEVMQAHREHGLTAKERKESQHLWALTDNAR